MIRRSIGWSSSPTARTCRCRSPACGSWRPAPSSASPPAGSIPRSSSCSPARPPSGSPSSAARRAPGLDRELLGLSGWASTRPGKLDFWGRFRRGVEAEAADVARDGGRLLLRDRLAHRGGRAHLRRDPDLRGAHRAGPDERRFPGGGAADRERAFPQRRDLGARRDPGDDAAGEHPGLHPPAREQPAAGAKRLEHAARAADGRRRGGWWTAPRRSRTAACRGGASACRRRCCGGGRTSGAELLADGAVRPHRHRQGGPLSELLAVRHDRDPGLEQRHPQAGQPTSARSSAAGACSTRSGPG